MKSHKERAMAHYLAQNQHIASPCSAARSEDRRIRRAARAHQRSCRQGSRLCLAAQVGIGQRHRHRLRQSFRDRQHARSGSKRWISPVIVSGGFPPVTSPPSPKAASGGNTTRSAARLRTPSGFHSTSHNLQTRVFALSKSGRPMLPMTKRGANAKIGP